MQAGNLAKKSKELAAAKRHLVDELGCMNWEEVEQLYPDATEEKLEEFLPDVSLSNSTFQY